MCNKDLCILNWGTDQICVHSHRTMAFIGYAGEESFGLVVALGSRRWYAKSLVCVHKTLLNPGS